MMYRGIYIVDDGSLGCDVFDKNTGKKSYYRIVVLTPDVERYVKTVKAAKSVIDKFLSKPYKPKNDIPF